DDPTKRLLQAASVIGREFPRRLLDRVTLPAERNEALLGTLKDLELIYEQAVAPEIAYTFKHALTQEVAYNSLLLQRRKELHHRIATGIEDAYADRLSDYEDVLAEHFRHAGVPDKALAYLLRAGEKAARAFATHEALALYAEAEQMATALGAAVPA